MAVGERARRELQEALMEAIGSDQTDTLLTYLPPAGWAEVATTRDVQALGAELRGEMASLGSELRGEMASLGSELRGEMASLGSELRAEMHHELRVQFFWLASLQLTVLAVVVAVFSTGLLG